MPIHDWTRVSAVGFHDFHQDWTIEIRRTLNRGLLPPGYAAFTDLRVNEYEPDLIAIHAPGPSAPGGLSVAVAPPRAKQVARVESEPAAYARKANRIVIRHEYGAVVAIVEIVLPGNKDSRHAIKSFTDKAVYFLQHGVSLLIIDLFPPTPRDPAGIHQVIWEQLTDEPFEARPADKPLTVAAYEVGSALTAYVDPVAVGDRLPDASLFLAPEWYVKVPLEQTYQASWDVTPKPIRDRVESGVPRRRERRDRRRVRLRVPLPLARRSVLWRRPAASATLAPGCHSADDRGRPTWAILPSSSATSGCCTRRR